MERKVIQIGEHTKLVTLPIEFTRRWNVRKGDILHIAINGKELVVRTDAKEESALLIVDSADANHLEKWYALGFDTIHITKEMLPDPHLFLLEKCDEQLILKAQEPSTDLQGLLQKIKLVHTHYPKEQKMLHLYTLQACRRTAKELPKTPFALLIHTLLLQMRPHQVLEQLETIYSLLPHTQVEA